MKQHSCILSFYLDLADGVKQVCPGDLLTVSEDLDIIFHDSYKNTKKKMKLKPGVELAFVKKHTKDGRQYIKVWGLDGFELDLLSTNLKVL